MSAVLVRYVNALFDRMNIPNELAWDASLSTKVARRVKWKRWNYTSIVGVVAIAVYTGDGKEGPSRWVARVWNAIGARLKEIDLVFGRAGNCTRQNYKELKDDASCEEN
jgi:hypothetical protein